MQNTIKLQGREAATFATMTNSYASFSPTPHVCDQREISSSEVAQLVKAGRLDRLGVDCQDDEQHRDEREHDQLDREALNAPEAHGWEQQLHFHKMSGWRRHLQHSTQIASSPVTGQPVLLYSTADGDAEDVERFWWIRYLRAALLAGHFVFAHREENCSARHSVLVSMRHPRFASARRRQRTVAARGPARSARARQERTGT